MQFVQVSESLQLVTKKIVAGTEKLQNYWVAKR